MKLLNRWFAQLGGATHHLSLPEDAARVYSQLYGLKNARHFAWCRFGKDKLTYQSMIIDVDVENRTVIMDEPFGLPPQFLWSPGQPIDVEIKDYANRIDFKTRFIRLDPENGENRMLVAWPAEVQSHQRRSIFRVSFHGGDEVPMLQFVDLATELLPCLDLSFQGVGVAVPHELGSQMYIDQALVIQLWLPNFEPIVAKLTVKRLDEIEDLGLFSLGATIDGVDSASKRMIDRFLVEEQRKEMKTRAS